MIKVVIVKILKEVDHVCVKNKTRIRSSRLGNHPGFRKDNAAHSGTHEPI